MNTNKTIFITGATAGFGKAIAYKFAAHGWNLILNGRREERLNIIEQDLKEQFNSKVLSLSTIQEGDIDDWEVMIDTNVKGLLYVSRQVMPMMVNQKHGHIINISSIAGKEAYARGNVYCATKHAVDALTKSMRIDLLEHGIKVTSIDPGAAETEFSIVRFHGDVERGKKSYQGYEPLRAEDIADIAYFAATRPAHVVLNDIVVTPLAQANTTYIFKKENKNS